MNTPKRDDELVFLPLGGSGEIGMNFNAYGYGPPDDRKWIVVDCGVLFGRETTSPGVDLIMPDIRFLAEQRENVIAIIATHAHEDHIGAIPHLWPMLRCPIYATPFTAVLIEGKLEEAGLADRVHPKRVPLSRQDRAWSIQNRIHVDHAFDSGAECARYPHAARRGRAYR